MIEWGDFTRVSYSSQVFAKKTAFSENGDMQPKQVVWTIAILNLIFIVIFVWLAQTAIFDRWVANKVLPNLCTEKQADGKVVFIFCDDTKSN